MKKLVLAGMVIANVLVGDLSAAEIPFGTSIKTTSGKFLKIDNTIENLYDDIWSVGWNKVNGFVTSGLACHFVYRTGTTYPYENRKATTSDTENIVNVRVKLKDFKSVVLRGNDNRGLSIFPAYKCVEAPEELKGWRYIAFKNISTFTPSIDDYTKCYYDTSKWKSAAYFNNGDSSVKIRDEQISSDSYEYTFMGLTKGMYTIVKGDRQWWFELY